MSSLPLGSPYPKYHMRIVNNWRFHRPMSVSRLTLFAVIQNCFVYIQKHCLDAPYVPAIWKSRYVCRGSPFHIYCRYVYIVINITQFINNSGRWHHTVFGLFRLSPPLAYLAFAKCFCSDSVETSLIDERKERRKMKIEWNCWMKTRTDGIRLRAVL